jgi:hypothetical protein
VKHDNISPENSFLRNSCLVREVVEEAKQQSHIMGINCKLTHNTREILSPPHLPFPSFFTASAESVQPPQGIRELSDTTTMPQSISTELAMSRPRDMFEPTPAPTDSNFVAGSEPQV